MGVWCIFAYMFVCANVRLIIDTFLSHCLFLKQSLSLNLGVHQLARPAGQRAPETHLSLPTSIVDIDIHEILSQTVSACLPPPKKLHKPQLIDRTLLSNEIYLPEIISSYNPYAKRIFRNNI